MRGSVLDERQKERVKFNTELLKVLALLFIATGGGSLTLIVEEIDAAREGVLAVAGMVFSITSGIFGLILYSNTKKLLE